LVLTSQNEHALSAVLLAIRMFISCATLLNLAGLICCPAGCCLAAGLSAEEFSAMHHVLIILLLLLLLGTFCHPFCSRVPTFGLDRHSGFFAQESPQSCAYIELNGLL
jgi:fatty acid desaturase